MTSNKFIVTRHVASFTLFGIAPYSVRMRENTDQNNSEYAHFLHSVTCIAKRVLVVWKSWRLKACYMNMYQQNNLLDYYLDYLYWPKHFSISRKGFPTIFNCNNGTKPLCGCHCVVLQDQWDSWTFCYKKTKMDPIFKLESAGILIFHSF